jgi:SAM-dependent MidA family methyltransferase
MTNQPLTIADSNPDLCAIIAQRIAASPQQRISFAEFMDLALYHPQHGYYSTRSTGIQRDFFTSPHLGKDFGELLAEQFAQLWEILDRPNPFTLVEMGAGQGLLVQDIVRYLHRHHFECFAALDYFIIEKSAALIAEQQQRLQPLTHSWSHLHWRTWADIPPNSIVGCCFSNELVDALPVHQIAIEAGQLREVYVTGGKDEGGRVGQKDEGGGMRDEASSLFGEVIAAPSTPKLAEYFKLIDLPFPSDRYADGYRSEVNLAALDWLDTVSDRLQRGYVLTIDYGYPAHRYYSPTRSEGTLQCYYQHRHHSNPYVAIGQQDITAHVDFTALERQGERSGLQTIGFTQQGLFLMALGLGDRIAALSTPEPDQSLQDILQRRETLHALADPMGLGNFGVLVQAKQLSEQEQQQTLKGFNIPPLF